MPGRQGAFWPGRPDGTGGSQSREAARATFDLFSRNSHDIGNSTKAECFNDCSAAALINPFRAYSTIGGSLPFGGIRTAVLICPCPTRKAGRSMPARF